MGGRTENDSPVFLLRRVEVKVFVQTYRVLVPHHGMGPRTTGDDEEIGSK